MRLPRRGTTLLVLMSLLLASSGCVRHKAHPIATSYDPSVVNIVRFDLPALRAVHDSVLSLFQLPPLVTSALPSGMREIRMSANGGWSYAPVPLLRVLATPQGTMGELYFWWPVYRDHPLRQHEESTFVAELRGRVQGCTTPTRGRQFAACRVQFSKQPDWRSIGLRLDSLNAWTLAGSDQVRSMDEERGINVSDQVGLRIERRVGATFQIGWYYHPEAYAGTVGQQLKGLLALLDASRQWR